MTILVILIIATIIWFYHRNHKPTHKSNNKPENQENKTFNRVVDELKQVGIKSKFLYTQKNQLAKMIDDDEHIMDAVSGYGKEDSAVMILTEQRIIVIERNTWYGFKNSDIPLDMINNVTAHTGLVASIKIVNGADSTSIKNINPDQANEFVNNTRRQSRKYKQSLMNGAVN